MTEAKSSSPLCDSMSSEASYTRRFKKKTASSHDLSPPCFSTLFFYGAMKLFKQIPFTI
jgi:hypothetical protein